MAQKEENSSTHHHHHHHHKHFIKSGDEKVTWEDVFSKSKYNDPTSRMRFNMEKHRKLKDFKRRLIFVSMAVVAVIVLLLVFFAYYVDKQ